LNVTSSSDVEGDAEIDVACISRAWVYVVIFCVVPLVFGTLGTVLLVREYRSKPRHAQSSTQMSTQFSVLNSRLDEDEF
jgi:hypothetical protein